MTHGCQVNTSAAWTFVNPSEFSIFQHTHYPNLHQIAPLQSWKYLKRSQWNKCWNVSFHKQNIPEDYRGSILQSPVRQRMYKTYQEESIKAILMILQEVRVEPRGNYKQLKDFLTRTTPMVWMEGLLKKKKESTPLTIWGLLNMAWTYKKGVGDGWDQNRMLCCVWAKKAQNYWWNSEFWSTTAKSTKECLNICQWTEPQEKEGRVECF